MLHRPLITSPGLQFSITQVGVGDDEALDAFHELTLLEGIIPALESSHAIAEARKRRATASADTILVVNLSGRGDKDLDTVLALDRTRKKGGAA